MSKETGMLDYRPIDSPADPNQKLLPSQGEAYSDPEKYLRLVEKLVYLTITMQWFKFWGTLQRHGKGLHCEDKGNTQVVGFYDAQRFTI